MAVAVVATPPWLQRRCGGAFASILYEAVSQAFAAGSLPPLAAAARALHLVCGGGGNGSGSNCAEPIIAASLGTTHDDDMLRARVSVPAGALAPLATWAGGRDSAPVESMRTQVQ